MVAHDRGLHRRGGRAARHVHASCFGACGSTEQQPPELHRVCLHRARAFGIEASRQRDCLVDRSAKPAHLPLVDKIFSTTLSAAAWTLAWNRWCPRPSRAIDGAALVLALIGVASGAMNATTMTRVCRLGLLALLMLIVVRIVRGGSMRIMALGTMAVILVSQFTGELRSIGIPDIWFPFGIGVTLVQYAYAIAIPLLGLLIVQTLHSDNNLVVETPSLRT